MAPETDLLTTVFTFPDPCLSGCLHRLSFACDPYVRLLSLYGLLVEKDTHTGS